ncbi:SDR family oxidoreductase [Amycolatopsis acidiphila]|uniref:SDR family oxidoreductase n=1 Tax=Amycolatopsis acidiphila TaxID=715473 RepID=UPI0019BFCD39|nr:SDR family oxidoreductase [Amycolatopsis acidiphila]UIJ57198.1 SDR family oxidoreductase [Amycolatopsis acidiphila]GHG52733.1 short chain dehydrogenase [Amycolatopsis acidiphila]
MSTAEHEPLAGRTALITGGSRGIGAAIALRFAAAGANVSLLATSGQPRPNRLPGTVYSVAGQVTEAGGKALGVVGDIRKDEDVEAAVARTVEEFGGLDIVVNNAAAFDTTPTSAIAMKKYDLVHAINARGSFLVSRTALPHLERSVAGHILTISPPLVLSGQWLGPHLAYTASKYAASLNTLGLAAELADRGVAANSLWPRTAVGTEGIRVILGEEVAGKRSRTPAVMADAALAIVSRDPRSFTGQLVTDEEVLRSEGVTDFSRYRLDGEESDLELSFFLPETTK